MENAHPDSQTRLSGLESESKPPEESRQISVRHSDESEARGDDTGHFRRIKSFVRREGRLTPSQAAALERWLPVYGVELSTDQPLNLSAIFGDDRPVILEIGFGNGDLLAEVARMNPDKGYIGAEVHRPGVGHLLSMLNTHKISNVRVFPDDVQLLLPRLPLGSLSAIYLFFPDPWPKKRHNKRRLVNPVWVKEISQRLKPGGILHMATDWEEYAYHMLEVMEGADHFVNNAGSGCFHPRPEWRPVTRFERRGERLGHNQWDLIFTFKGEKS